MVRTRAADRQDVPEPSTRRNPSRPSRVHVSAPPTRSTRSRKAVVYPRDTSSDEGDSDSSHNSLDPPSEPDVEGDSDSGDQPHFQTRSRRNKSRSTTNASARVRSRRSARQAAMGQAQPDPAPSHSDTRSNARQQAKKRPKPLHRKGRSSKKQRTSPEAEQIPRGVIPNWRDPQIPYGAWVDIFYYAAMSGGHDTLDVNWLISTATTCKAFSEAALTAIYRCPPLLTAAKARRFAALLELPPSGTRFNYRAKVESLYVDVQVVPQALLPQMIHVLPRLAEVILFTQSDQPPYRELDRTVRWQYSTDILHSFRPSSGQVGQVNAEEKSFYTVLKSWEWSGSLLGGPVTTAKDMSLVHQEPSFAHLTKLSFTNFQVPSLYKPRPKPGDEERELELYNEDGAMIDSIAEAISQLKSLSHLVFESSTVMNERLLPLLPKDLVHLGLINCWEIKSEEFASFLHSHGRRLRSLDLSHNQSLDLVFLTTLADACPQLEELYMNLSYFRHHDSLSLVNNDADPLYEQALLPHQIPQWPSSLRVIDFEHIRHWSVETAEMFLQSLIDSAGSLPNLRHLAVKTMLNIPWKARATMRHEWRRKLDRVFLRPFEAPKKHYSLRQTEEETERVVEKKAKPKRLSDGPSRRSTRLAAQASDSDSRHSNNSKGLRSLHGRPTYAEPETDENEFDSDSEQARDAAGSSPSSQIENEAERAGSQEPLPTKTLVIQGLCTSVAIVFDNQKPTEVQYGMEDFMDQDRAESDDEWDGDQEDDDDAVFVWR